MDINQLAVLKSTEELPGNNIAQKIAGLLKKIPQLSNVTFFPKLPSTSFEIGQKIGEAKYKAGQMDKITQKVAKFGYKSLTDQEKKMFTEDIVKMAGTIALGTHQTNISGSGSRPWHQKALEEARNRGDFAEVSRILEQIPKNDPYRSAMYKLFEPRSQAEAFMGGTQTNLEQLTNLAKQYDNYDDFLQAVVGSGKFHDELVNPISHTGFKSLLDLFNTVVGRVLQ